MSPARQIVSRQLLGILALAQSFLLRTSGLKMNRIILTVATILWASACDAVTIDWVPVGNAGNPADTAVMNDGTTGYGAVDYDYSIDKFEITNAQYAAFLNAVAADDTYHVYPVGSPIARIGNQGSYSYSVNPGWDNFPMAYVSWGSAARFANWLANGQPGLGVGAGVAENCNSTEDGSYALNGAMTNAALNGVTREPGATIVIPTEDEWYKAAYYNPASGSYYLYPTSSDSIPHHGMAPNIPNSATYSSSLTPVGFWTMSASPSGTFDQAGETWEWNESLVSNSADPAAFRGLRGGSYQTDRIALESTYRNGFYPTVVGIDIGFRVATVPEPSSITLAVVALVGFVALCRRKQG